MEEPKKTQKPRYAETIRIDVKYIEKLRELLNDLTIEVKKSDNRKVKDFMVKPRKPGLAPAVIVLHDWWGINDHVRAVCMQFAKYGYAAYAPDLFAGNVTDKLEYAKYMMRQLDPYEVIKTVAIACRKLQSQVFVDPKKIVIMGSMMGGYYALFAASRMPELKAAVSFYGRFPKDVTRETARIECPVLFFSGQSGDWFEQEESRHIEESFIKNRIPAQVVRFEEAPLAFFDDLHLEGYHEPSAQKAWREMVRFFKEALSEKKGSRFPSLRKRWGALGNSVLDRFEESRMIGRFLDILEEVFKEDAETSKKRY